MQVGDYIKASVDRLNTAGIETARIDCLVLMEDVIGKDRSALLAHPEIELNKHQLTILNAFVDRRTRHEPLAYIRGKTEFYGREFKVNKHVLEPRPESETMITQLKKIVNSQNSSPLEVRPLAESRNVNWHIVDVGTGSGCLAVTAKLECPQAQVSATDISPACIKIATENAIRHKVEVTYCLGDLLDVSEIKNLDQVTCVLANLPYVPDNHTINMAAKHEPRIAVFGGPDGLDVYRRLFQQILSSPNKPSYIVTESLPFQHQNLKQIARGADYTERAEVDFIQVFTIR